jgi:phenylacetate-coenzyme A ligase PaaK-like adenylate-forming protein
MTKLEQMLKYVSEHNDFYKKRIKEYGITNPLDITQWPILTRKELQENRYNMFSDGYKSKYFNQQLRRQSSSGSTGVPVNVYWDYKDWYASNMCLWRKRKEWYGISPHNKYVVFTLNSFNLEANCSSVYYIQNPKNVLSVNVSLLQNEKQYKELALVINKFDPDWLYIQPFMLNILMQTYNKFDIESPKALKYIESVGEILTPDLRKRATAFFGVPLVNMYGSEEMNCIAYECPNKHMHIIRDNVYLETDTLDSDVNAIITSLNNHAMPLIRYAQGDIINYDTLPLRCVFEESKSIIKLIKGRELSIFTIGDHQYGLSTFVLLEIIAEANNLFDDIIKEYRYKYVKNENKLLLYLALYEKRVGWYENIIKTLKSIFRRKVKSSTVFEIIILDKMPAQWQCRKDVVMVI